MKYCKQCGRAIKMGSACPFCGSKRILDSRSEEFKNKPVTKNPIVLDENKKKTFRGKVLLIVIIISAVAVIVGSFVVLDMTGVIPTGIFRTDEGSSSYADDDGDSRVRYDDDLISETVPDDYKGDKE